MRHLYRNIALVVIVCLICAAALWPPEKKLHLGKDLAGGVSLTYAVQLSPGDPPQMVDQVIDVLSKRVNPSGLFEISFTKQGRDRIEVSMPLPSQRVQNLRQTLDTAIEAMGAFELDSSAVERALRAPEGEREAALDALMTSPPRRALLEPIRDALASAEEARAAFAAAKANPSTTRGELDQLVDAAGSAEEKLDQAKARALTSSVSTDEVRAILRRSQEVAYITDSATKQQIKLDSAFEKGINSVHARIDSLPGGPEAIAAVLAANDAYLAEAKGLDDPQDLERLLQGSGVLEFRIGIRPNARTDEASLRDQLHQRGPSGVKADGVRWYPVNKATDWFSTVEQLQALEADPASFFANTWRLVGDSYGGEYFLLLSDDAGSRLTAAEGNWRLTGVSQTADEMGRPAVLFTMDPSGGIKLGAMTERHVNEPMAVLLDGKVFTAPNINSRLGRSVIIQGRFTPQEIAYLQQTLKAGSLSARLSEKPLSITRLAPELGQDNLDKGIRAGVIALSVVSAFMIMYYYTAGVVATIALLVNGLVILGIMSLNRAAFTLPGIAGIILTFGMAVDANVLIYERLREEFKLGHDLKTAMRVSYARVATTIVDTHVTTLIACVVLAYTATQEIKGFAITLGIGVIGTLFSALIVTRVIFAILIDKFGMRKMGQLPMTFPFIDRLWHPNIDWIALRPLLWSISAIFVGMGLYFCVNLGGNLLDTEFRGGTAVDIRLSIPKDGETITFTAHDANGKPGTPVAFTGTLSITDVRNEVQSIGRAAREAAEANPADANAKQLMQLETASVVAVGDDPSVSNWFRVKTLVTDEELVLGALMERFASVVGTEEPLRFAGSDQEELANAPVHVIDEPVLGNNEWLGRSEVRDDVSSFVGGAAISLSGITPPVSRSEIQERLDFVRGQGDYVSQTAQRTMHLIILDGTDDAVRSAVIVISDPNINAMFDADKWRTAFAAQEWTITRDALAQATTTASVESFSAEVAATFRAKAIVAVSISFLLIGIYIWVRFGALRYSLACMFSTLHDVVTVIGMIALAHVIYAMNPAVARFGIRPYQIDLGMVAAIMTIIGYSLNDSIIILDRIRENRGKLPYATRKVINDSINQTISRTVITSGTTLMAVVVMLIVGGDGLASFNYALFCGIVIGTFSSIAVAAPCVYTRRIPEAAKAIMDSAEAHEKGLATREPVPMG